MLLATPALQSTCNPYNGRVRGNFRVRCESRFSREYPAGRGLVVAALRTVGARLAAAGKQGAQTGLDMLQTGGHQGAVAVVPASGLGGGLRAQGPAARQRALGVAPAQQVFQTLEVYRTTHVAAQGAPLLVRADDYRNAALALTRGAFQRYNVIRLE